MLPARTLLREAAGCAILAAVATLACTSLTGSAVGTSSVGLQTYQPQTGIAIDSNGLFNGLGCGRGPGLPFKYVVQVYGALEECPEGGAVLEVGQSCLPEGGLEDAGDAGGDAGDAGEGGAPLAEPLPIAQSVNDCFADAVFENLTTQLGGGNLFYIVIDVYDDVTFDRASNGFLATQLTPRSVVARGEPASCCAPQNPVTSCTAVPSPGVAIPHDCTTEYTEAANWTTTCFVHQSPNVQVVAACGPLVATGH